MYDRFSSTNWCMMLTVNNSSIYVFFFRSLVSFAACLNCSKIYASVGKLPWMIFDRAKCFSNNFLTKSLKVLPVLKWPQFLAFVRMQRWTNILYSVDILCMFSSAARFIIFMIFSMLAKLVHFYGLHDCKHPNVLVICFRTE